MRLVTCYALMVVAAPFAIPGLVGMWLMWLSSVIRHMDSRGLAPIGKEDEPERPRMVSTILALRYIPVAVMWAISTPFVLLGSVGIVLCVAGFTIKYWRADDVLRPNEKGVTK